MTNTKDQYEGATRQPDLDATRERVANAWVELLEAAKTDPKARAFLAAFGPAETTHAAEDGRGADGQRHRVRDGDGSAHGRGGDGGASGHRQVAPDGDEHGSGPAG